MVEDLFDDIIKEKLTQHRPSIDFGTWQRVQSNLEADQHSSSNDDELDRHIKEKMLPSKADYKALHWQLMSDQLKHIEKRKNTIYISKVLECLAIFLIAFTYTKLVPIFEKQKELPAVRVQYAQAVTTKQQAIAQDEKQSSIHNDPSNSNTILHQKSIFAQASAIKKLEMSPDILTISTMQTAELTTESNEIYQGKTINPAFTPIMETSLASAPADVTPHLQPISIAAIPAIQNIALSSSKKMPQIEISNVFPHKKSTPPIQPIYQVGLFGTADIILINTPYDQIFSVDSYNKEALNNTFGVNFSRKAKSLELETGFAISSRTYQPKIVKDEYGNFPDFYFEKSLQKISYEIFSVPLNLKYHFINQPTWSAYVMCGAALNLVMDAEYDIEQLKIQGKQSLQRFEQPRLNDKPFTNGVLNGGSISENYFVTAGVGFGIEKRLTDFLSLYVQPSYHRHLQSYGGGIGPNNDLIHTSSIQVGVKAVLN